MHTSAAGRCWGGLSDELWAQIAPLIPKPIDRHPLGCHRPRVPDRTAMEAIIFVLRTGCQWNALNATGICTSSSAHRRFTEWTRAGVFERLWQAGLMQHAQLRAIDWSWLALEAAQTKAPLGGEESGANPTDRGRRGTKRSVLTAANGLPIAVLVAAANCPDHELTAATLGALQLPEPGHDAAPMLCADSGYGYPYIHALIAQRGWPACIAPRRQHGRLRLRRRKPATARRAQQAGAAKSAPRTPRWVVEVVFTQLTKSNVLAVGAGR